MYKTIRWAAVVVLALASPALYALGLGSAKVNSYLNQPLDVRVELISQSSEELQSVTAGLATAKDFELLGLKLNSISIPLEFEIVTEANKSYIHITSALTVTSPIMQVLIEVVWANGRMLREYTLFLDPPAFDSKAPAPQGSKPAAAGTGPSVAAQTAPQQTPPSQSVPTPPAGISADRSVDGSADLEAQTRSANATNSVDKGQTLWGIASDWSRGTGYNVNQAMLAIQQKNPEAFINDNINLLKQGEILRMPATDEMAAISSQQAALEVQRQASAFSPGLNVPALATPTVADSGDYQDTYLDDAAGAQEDLSEGLLEIVPPSETDNDAMGAIAQASDEVTADNVEGQVLQEKLTRAEEDLINAELENSYLKDRIAELEQEAEVAKNVQVQDETFAGMEQAMADKRASDEPAPPVALTPGGEQQPWYAGATVWLIAAVLFLILLIVWFLRRKGRLDSESLQEIESKSAVQAATDDAEDLLDLLDNYGGGSSTRKSPDYEGQAALDAEDDFADQFQDEPEDQDGDTVVDPALAAVVHESESDPEDAELTPEPVIRLPDESASDLDDFDFGSDADTETDELEVETQPFSDAHSDDESEDGDTVVAESEEVNDPELKLDLARAYLSLGDKEAAKSMLDEVLLNGNEDQIAEAEQMLDEL